MIRSVFLKDFKSFRRAKLPLSPGFTVIVGPNGSGKSNIIDGILFVLGERRIRHLRAERLKDLVNINSRTGTGVVSIDFGDFTVSREINKKGGSVYRVNGKTRSKKEVMELLESKGIPTDGHNVIMQGEVTSLLEMNPKERREILDEVAEISFYEEKKEEALKNLEEVESRITVTREVLGEKLKILEELEEEVKKARRYKELTEILKDLKYTVMVLKRRDLEKRREEIERELEEIRRKRVEKEKEMAEMERALEAERATVEELRRRMWESIGRELAAKESKLEEKKKRMEELKGEVEKLKEKEAREKSRLEEVERGIEKIDREIVKTERMVRELEGKVGEVEEVVGLVEKREELVSRLAEVKREIELLERAMAEVEDIRDLEKKREELLREEKELNSRLETLLADLIKKREALAGIKVRGGGIDLGEVLRGVEGVYGTLGDLIDYPDEYADAVEAAAGRSLFYVVVRDADTAVKCIRILRERKLGNATFIPLDRIRAGAPVRTSEGVPLMDVIRYPPEVERAVRYVFGGTVMVEDKDTAKRLQGKFRVVTRDGVLFEKSGLISGGSRKVVPVQRAKKLEKEVADIKSEIESVKGRLYVIREELSRIREKMGSIRGKLPENAEERLKALRREREELEELLSQMKPVAVEEIKTVANELSRAREELAGLRERKKALMEEMFRIRSELEELEEEKSKLEGEIDTLETEVGVLQGEIEELRGKDEETASQLKEAEEKVRNLDISVSVLQSDVNALEKRESELLSLLNGIKADLEELEREMGETGGKMVNVEDPEMEMRKIEKELEELGPVHLGVEELYREKKEELGGIEEKLKTLEREKEKVLSMIREIEEKKVKRLMEVFQAVKRNFQQIVEELGIGEGDLELQGADPTQAGLIIKVRPKGMKIRSLDTLSGGEKALTALAFLFAVSRYRPSPFYIMDEPDLMLDKLNTELLAKFVKKMSKKSQFIVVSHRDEMIRYADQIVGVYMQGDGSSVIEVLNEAPSPS